MIEFMKKTRDIYYTERKKLSFSFSAYNRLTKPEWMQQSKDNRFEATYIDHGMLLRKGRIAIAKIVQANSLLYKPGEDNCPAAMVFSEDPYFEENPDKLGEIAYRLYGIKGSRCDDEELQRFSDILADEIVTLFNVEIPQKITYSRKVYFTSLMVHREHLPNRYIDFGCFPALIYPEKTEASIILPSRYWASESSDAKKTMKILSDEKLMELLDNDPAKYIEVIQEHIDYAYRKSRTSWLNKDKWLTKYSHYRYQKTTALLYCGRHGEAEELLKGLLYAIDKDKVQGNSYEYYIIVLSNLVSALIGLERYEEAKENIILLEKTMSICRDELSVISINRILKWKLMELDILNGDLERGGCYLKSLLESVTSKASLGNTYLYLGIYHFKRNEKVKALEYFNKASDMIKDPYSRERIQHYKSMLI